MLDFGAVGDGTTDDAQAFQDAIDDAPQGGAVHVPAGDYLLGSGLTMDHGVVLCGEGPDQSRLLFDAESTAISMVVYDRGDWVALESGYDHGSDTLVVADGATFAAGDHAELQQDNNWDRMDPEGEWRNASWVPEAAMGQMVQIVAVAGNTFFRNRVESEGIQIMDYSHDQNVVGNELTTAPNIVEVDDTCGGVLIHANLQDGAIGYHPDIPEHTLPASLYLTTAPPFFGGLPWPATGADVATDGHTLPAHQRWIDTAGP